MSRAVLALSVLGFVGLVLVLAEIPWFARRALVDRLRPYAPGIPDRRRDTGVLSVESFREVIAPLASMIGNRVASAFGVQEDLALRLHRVHATIDPTVFRVRQVAWGFGALLAGGALSLALGLPAIGSLLFVIGGPLLAFLVLEQRVASASARWQRRIVLELPVVAEQLGMLLGAGYSLAAALNRVAQRGNGACATDLQRVCSRMRHGLSDTAALTEWARTADVVALHRLVGVLALNRQAADLSRLITDEARSIRRDAQRDVIESIERRTQMVWIPVTVAALVPGVIFMAVPFVRALSLFSGT